MRSFSGLALGLLTATLCFGCEQPPPLRQIRTDSPLVAKAWEEVFPHAEEIRLDLPEDGPKLLQIAHLREAPDGTLIIPDGRARRVLLFKSNGVLAREVDGGENGEFDVSVLGSAAVSATRDLWVFDPDGRWVTVLGSPAFRVIRRFQIPAMIADMVPLPDNTFLSYSPAEEKAFQKFDGMGRHLASAYRVRDQRLRLFHARIQTGGITRTPEGEIVGIHPAAFELVRLSPSLDVLEVIRAPEGSRWHPYPKELPEDLSPYDHTPAHEEWWDSFGHIGTIHSLGRNLLLVTTFASSGLRDWSESVNLYQLDNDVFLLAEGLGVPHGARIVGAGNQHVYLARNARLGDNDSIEPLALYRYTLDPKVP